MKNVEIETIDLTPKNVVLEKIRETTKSNGDIDKTINVIEVGDAKNTSGIELVKVLLKFALAEYAVSSDFANEYKDTKIKQSAILKPFLTSKVIFKTDSDGFVSKAVISEVELNKTALNLKADHTLVTCENKN